MAALAVLHAFLRGKPEITRFGVERTTFSTPEHFSWHKRGVLNRLVKVSELHLS
jgi:hypothetical protein